MEKNMDMEIGRNGMEGMNGRRNGRVEPEHGQWNGKRKKNPKRKLIKGIWKETRSVASSVQK